MSDIGFEPRKIIPQMVCRLEVLSAEKADTYGPQIGLKLKVVGEEHDGHTFINYANRDEDTGHIKQGSKGWSIFEACLGQNFYKRPGVSLESLVGKQFMGKVTQTRTGSRKTRSSTAPRDLCRRRRSRRPRSRMTETMMGSTTFRFEVGRQRGEFDALPLASRLHKWCQPPMT
jgi:hypothetical protein